MNVRIVTYRKAKELDKHSPRGLAFGYPKSSSVWGNWVRVVCNDGGFSGVLVEPLDELGTFYMLPLCCVRQKYAREALLGDKSSD